MTNSIAVLDSSPPGPFSIAHPRHDLRFALNECNGSYWVPGLRGHWEIAPTPFGALAATSAFLCDPAPARLLTLAAYGSALRNGHCDAQRVLQDDLTSRGALTAPWEHQRRTLDWLLERTALPGSGALLYLGLGTGKTRIVLDWLRLRHIRRALVVAPRAVLPAWEKEARRHYGDTFDVWVANEKKTTEHKAHFAREFLLETRKPALLVVNYDIVWRKEFSQMIESAGFECVIADECHRLKGRSSKRSLYFRTAWKRHPYRIALTGTPMSNGVLTDVFGPYAFLDPGIYGQSIARFEERYAVKHARERWLVLGWRNTEDFYRRFWLIARHEDRSVLTLPPIVEQDRMVTLPPDARRAYHGMQEELIAEIRNGVVTAANAGVAIMKLQQMASGSVIAADGSTLRIHTEKQSALEDVLRETGAEPVVVFAIFRNDLAAIHDACAAVGVASLELSGSRDELARWQDGEATVLAVQIQSGSEGISLVRATYGIFFSPSYALAQMDQAKARLHRPGQERPVTLIHLLAASTVDTQITRTLGRKQSFVQALLDSRGSLLAERDERAT